MCRALSELLLKCFAGQQHQYFDNLRKQTKEPMNNCKMGIISNYGTRKLQSFYFNVGMKEFWLFRNRQKQAIAWIPDPVQAGITTDFPGLHFKHKGNMIMNGNSTFWPNYPFIGAHFFYYVFSQLSSWDWCLNQPCFKDWFWCIKSIWGNTFVLKLPPLHKSTNIIYEKCKWEGICIGFCV